MSDMSEQYGQSPGGSMQIPAKKNLPAGLIAICVIAIVLGVLGLMGVFFGAIALVAGDQMQGAFAPPVDQGRAAYEELQGKIQAVGKEFMIYSILEMLLHVATAALLLIGAIATLRRRTFGPTALSIASAATIPYLLLSGALFVIVQLQILPLQQEFGRAVSGQQAPGAPNQETLFLVITVVSIAFRLILSLIEIIFYTITILYLRRPKVRAIYEPGVFSAEHL